ncbi:MAG: hypothetical protein H0U95_08920 [Bacteroidetes bacterium]|nr:hypothetical protein [Bacteroidota bacterium]
MKNINYILAMILIILWIVCFFTQTQGYAFHLLLVGGLGLILVNVIYDDKNNFTEKI